MTDFDNLIPDDVNYPPNPGRSGVGTIHVFSCLICGQGVLGHSRRKGLVTRTDQVNAAFLGISTYPLCRSNCRHVLDKATTQRAWRCGIFNPPIKKKPAIQFALPTAPTQRQVGIQSAAQYFLPAEADAPSVKAHPADKSESPSLDRVEPRERGSSLAMAFCPKDPPRMRCLVGQRVPA